MKSIILKSHEVRQLQKTGRVQIRRVVKLDGLSNQPLTSEAPEMQQELYTGKLFWRWFTETGITRGLMCPLGQPGEVRFIKETWAAIEAAGTPLIYRADADSDGSVPYLVHGSPMGGGVGSARPDLWRSSIHMPQSASRLSTTTTAVRVERLNGISEADAMLTGVEFDSGWEESDGSDGFGWMNYLSDDDSFSCRTAADSYRTMWESQHGKGSFDDRFVWVVDLEVVN